MAIDFVKPPELWLPPKPAILRPWEEPKRASFPCPVFCPRASGPAPGTTYPTVVTTNNGHATVALASTTFAATLPSGISAGDLLLLFIAESPGTSSTFTSMATPSGWTAMWASGSTTPALAGYYKTASGSEGSFVTISVTKSGTLNVAWTAYRITGNTGAPVWGTLATGTASSTNNANPPSLTSGFGSVATLWIALGDSNMAIVAVSGTPANYSNLLEDGTSSLDIASMTRNLTSASEDPGNIVFSGSGFGRWYAQTIAVQGT